MHAWLKKILALATVTAAVTLAPVSDADAALNAYLNLKGQKTGELKGDSPRKAVKAKAKSSASSGIELLGFSYEIKSPRDSASGQATGKTRHSAFQVTLELDTNIIAILIGMMESGETLEGTISLTTEKKGKQEYLTYELKNVQITSYQISSHTGGKDVIILDLAPQSFQAKTADGTVFASSSASVSKKRAHKIAK